MACRTARHLNLWVATREIFGNPPSTYLIDNNLVWDLLATALDIGDLAEAPPEPSVIGPDVAYLTSARSAKPAEHRG